MKNTASSTPAQRFAAPQPKRTAAAMSNPPTQEKDQKRQPDVKRTRRQGGEAQYEHLIKETAEEMRERRFGPGEEGKKKAEVYVKETMAQCIAEEEEKNKKRQAANDEYQSLQDERDAAASLRSRKVQPQQQQRPQSLRASSSSPAAAPSRQQPSRPPPRPQARVPTSVSASSGDGDEYGCDIDDSALAAMPMPGDDGYDEGASLPDGDYANSVMNNITDQDEDDGKPNPFITRQRSSQVIYPPYTTFEDGKVIFAKAPVDCKEGQMLYVNYRYDDKSYGPLLINTPCMACPPGVKCFEGDRMSAMLSLGRNWAEDPTMCAFKETVGRIETACIDAIFEKKWGGPRATKAQIRDAFSSIIYVKPDQEGNDYPPAINTVISNSKTCKTHIMKAPKLIPVPPNCVGKNSRLTCALEFRWIHRKTQSKRNLFPLGCSFSVNIAISQAVLHAATSSIPSNVCVVQFSDDTEQQQQQPAVPATPPQQAQQQAPKAPSKKPQDEAPKTPTATPLGKQPTSKKNAEMADDTEGSASASAGVKRTENADDGEDDPFASTVSGDSTFSLTKKDDESSKADEDEEEVPFDTDSEEERQKKYAARAAAQEQQQQQQKKEAAKTDVKAAADKKEEEVKKE